MTLKSVCLLRVKVSRVNLASAKEQICQWIGQGVKAYVCVAPVSTLVEARRHPQYAQVLNEASMVTPDGMPVVWLAKLKGCAEVGRTYGPDLMRELCRQTGLRHFFYGGTEQILALLCAHLKKDVPGINIVGVFSPPFRDHATLEGPDIIARINQAKPDIVWVGLGSPKQDYWMRLNRGRLDAPVLAGVGAAFDFMAGTKPQAAVWMQESGLEWLFRLCCEPGRLWKRYLIGNFLFLFYLLKDSFRKCP